jgi:hypothetical protein
MQRVERALAASPVTETVLNIFKAVLSTTPFTGGIASLITDYIPSSRFRRVEEFAQQFAEDLKSVADRVDQGYLSTDEFAHIFERSFKGAAEHYQREKLEAFRGILVNAAVHSDVDQVQKEHYLVLVNNLSVLQLRILMFMAAPRRYLADVGIDERAVRGGFGEMFRTVLPGIDTELVQSAFGDLYQTGLISTDKTIFGTMTSAQGLQLLGNRLTPLGHRFIEFLRPPPRPDA